MVKQIDCFFRKFNLVQFIDKHIGARIQLRRLLLGLSIDDLGNKTGCSAIHIQKYEQGLDRVHASKLFELAIVLRVSVTHFFEGLEAPPLQKCSSEGAFTYDKDATDMIASYYVACPKKREEVFAHAAALGKPHSGKLN